MAAEQLQQQSSFGKFLKEFSNVYFVRLVLKVGSCVAVGTSEL